MNEEVIYGLQNIIDERNEIIDEALHKIVNYKEIMNKLKEYIITHKIYDEVKFKSELLKIIGGNE